MPSHVKTYDGSGDPEDHLKLFQSAARTEGWAMPTWCHMFNSTLTGKPRLLVFDKLPKKSIDSYEDLRQSVRGSRCTQDHSPNKKVSSSWKPSRGRGQTDLQEGFKNKQRPDRKPDRFSLLTKTPKEIFTLEKGKFKAPPPMWPSPGLPRASLREDSNVYQPQSEETGRGPDDSSKLKWVSDTLCIGYTLTVEHPRRSSFLSKSAEKSLPFFSNLEKIAKTSDFQWTPEAEEAFKQMKKLIAELPTLTAPREREELIIYLAAAIEAISAVLMTDREGRQIPVYFVNRTLPWPGSTLRRCNNKSTDQRKLLSSSEISGRMLKWKFELEGYDIQYRPRTAIKGQILADFIMERPEDESPDELMAEPEALPEPWTLDPSADPVIDNPSADPPIGRSVRGKHLRPFNTIVADPCPTRDPLRPLLK
ncbi:reverse transcriptase domain-containing protein [Tanacetum coccineum]